MTGTVADCRATVADRLVRVCVAPYVVGARRSPGSVTRALVPSRRSGPCSRPRGDIRIVES